MISIAEFDAKLAWLLLKILAMVGPRQTKKRELPHIALLASNHPGNELGSQHRVSAALRRHGYFVVSFDYTYQ